MSLSRFCRIVAAATLAIAAGIAPSATAADTIYSRSPEASVLTTNGRSSPQPTLDAETGSAAGVDSRGDAVESILGRESAGPKGDSRHKKIGTARQPVVTNVQRDVDTLGRASQFL
jgi:hypothetical protein